MRRAGVLLAVALISFATVPGASAQVATARCNDGTLSYSATHSGSCSHHGGVAVFLDGTNSMGTSSQRPTGIISAGCPNGTYENVAGDTVCRPFNSPVVPAGATAQCNDGSYSMSQNRQGTCSSHGGVRQFLVDDGGGSTASTVPAAAATCVTATCIVSISPAAPAAASTIVAVLERTG